MLITAGRSAHKLSSFAGSHSAGSGSVPGCHSTLLGVAVPLATPIGRVVIVNASSH